MVLAACGSNGEDEPIATAVDEPTPSELEATDTSEADDVAAEPSVTTSDEVEPERTVDLAEACNLLEPILVAGYGITQDPALAATAFGSAVEVAPDDVVADFALVADGLAVEPPGDELAVLELFDDEVFLAALDSAAVFINENCAESIDDSANLYDPEEDGEIREGVPSVHGLSDFLDREYRESTWRLTLSFFSAGPTQVSVGGSFPDGDADAVCAALIDYANEFDTVTEVRVLDRNDEVVLAGAPGESCAPPAEEPDTDNDAVTTEDAVDETGVAATDETGSPEESAATPVPAPIDGVIPPNGQAGTIDVPP